MKIKLYETKYGVKLYMEEGCWLAARILTTKGPYQNRNLKALKQWCPKSRVTLDIGANVGMNSIEYARFSDKVYAWEPFAETAKLAKMNFKENDVTKVTLFECGLGSKDEIVWSQIQPHNDGQNRVAPRQKKDIECIDGVVGKPRCANGPQIEVKTLDQYNLDNVDIIKIDVEGYEFEVLRGAENTIDKCRPFIQVEVDASYLRKFNTTPQKIYNWFIEKDYIPYKYNGQKLPLIWKKERGIMDIFFVPEEKEKIDE